MTGKQETTGEKYITRSFVICTPHEIELGCWIKLAWGALSNCTHI